MIILFRNIHHPATHHLALDLFIARNQLQNQREDIAGREGRIY